MQQEIANEINEEDGTAALVADCQVTAHLAFWRQYYELGCRCIHFGELKILPSGVADQEAVAHYQANCQCSRNPSVSMADRHGG